MRPRIDGACILITGASSGIGREFARQLAGRAGVLILVARRMDRLQALAADLVARHPGTRYLPISCDLADRAATDAMLAQVERDVGVVEVLINNAGLATFGSYDRADWAKTEQLLQLNVVTLSYLTHRLIRPMIARRQGAILNISSGFGLQFLPGYAAYIGSKHYVTGFTEGLRLDTTGTGVVVSQLCPGPTVTEFFDVAGHVAGMEVPGFLLQSVESCVRRGLRGFERGRALIIPHLPIRILLALGAISPRFLRRLTMRPLARRLRRLELPPAPRR